jgi:D-alanine transaminase
MALVYLNGAYVPYEEALIPVEDRGFLFGDGIYEVVRIYGGRPFALEAHLRRMRRSAAALRLPWPEAAADLPGVIHRLLAENGLREAMAYLQITRGVAPRAHAFPRSVSPTVLVLTRTVSPLPAEAYERGVDAITTPDIRWHRADIKTTNLAANVLAKQEAVERGAHEALFVRDGVIIEGSSTNVFAVREGTLVTFPLSHLILAGITRAFVLELAREAGYPVCEGPIFLSDLPRLQELFVTGTLSEVLPIVRVDGREIGDGRPGPITRALMQKYRERHEQGDSQGYPKGDLG